MNQDTNTHPPFYARSRQLARMAELLESAMAGTSSVCFVTGEPGAGKSALLLEFARQAKARFPDLVIAAGDCNPQTGNEEPYLPFREILSDLTDEEAKQSGPDTVERPPSRFLETAKRVVAEHGPDLVDIFVPGGAIITRVGAQAAKQVRSRRKEARAAVGLNQGIDQHHLFEQYTNVLRSLADRQPLVLFIDDLHWADQASTNLLFHLSRRLLQERILLVGAYRGADVTGPQGAKNALAAKIPDLKRYHGEAWVDLDEVDTQEALAFTQAAVDNQPNRLDDAFRQALFQHTGGHALFTVELLRFAKSTGRLVKDEQGYWVAGEQFSWEGLPARIEGVIAERLAGLTAQEHELLEIASVMGTSFLADAVAHVAGQDARATIGLLSGPISRAHGLARAVGFERAGGKRVARYEFQHNLFQKYFYDSLDPVQRGLLHESSGLALETLYGPENRAAAVTLAWHFREAELIDKALTYHLLAGHVSHEEYANSEALSHYRAALHLAQSAAPEVLDQGQRQESQAEACTCIGQVLLRQGDSVAALEHFRAALGHTAEGEALRRAELHRLIASGLERLRRHEEAIAELRLAERLIGPPDESSPPERWGSWIDICMDQARVHYWSGDVAAMTPLLERLAAEIDRHGDANQRCHFWAGQAMRGYRVDRYAPTESTFEASRNALEAARASGNPINIVQSQFSVAFTHMLDMQPIPAIPLFEEALQLARRCGDLGLEARNLAYLLTAHRIAGDVDAAQRLLQEARAAAESCGMQDYVGVADANQAWLALRADEPEATCEHAQATLDRWLEHSRGFPFQWLALLPLLQVATSQRDIERAFHTAARLLDPAQARLPEAMERHLRRAASSADSGDTPAALEELEQALELAAERGYL